MESTDLKQVLSGPGTDTETVDVTKKPLEKQILHKKGEIHDDGFDKISDFLEDDKEVEVSMYDKSWTKLAKGMKLNRLQLFTEHEKIEKGLTDEESSELKTLLFKMCNDGLFNKANIVDYENEKISSIKILEYDCKTKTYKGKKQKKKVRTTPKSKSNLDRLLKK